jgi:hypothetical protein
MILYWRIVDARWMAIVYESMKLNGCQRRQQTHEKGVFAIVHCLKMWQHELGLHKTKVYTNDVSSKHFGTHAQVNAKPLRWHNTLAIMEVDLIHKAGHRNRVRNVLSEREEFQAMIII